MSSKLVIAALAAVALGSAAYAADLMPGFQRSQFWGEQTRETKTAEGIRIYVNAPEQVHPDLPTTVIFFGTPNGNTIEQTLGSKMTPGLDWHYDIQHIAAQTRLLRAVSPKQNIVLTCVEAEGRSWPGWRSKHADNASLIRAMVENTIKGLPGKEVSVVLSGHSGGGSMIFGFLNSADTIPAYVKRIACLDANYAYSDTDKHGDKLIAWLNSSPKNTLVVIAYDDRNITLSGKPVNGPTAGTYRATERMRTRFSSDMKLGHAIEGDVDRYTCLGGRAAFIVHRNPANKILHTVLVGEMNGFLEAMTLNTPVHSKWGKFGTPRAYTKWVQDAPPSVTPTPTATAAEGSTPPAQPIRSAADGGTAFMKSIAALPREQREAAITREIEAGNSPAFMGKLVTVKISGVDAKGKSHTASYEVSPDYLAVGTNEDFVRVPLTPMAAQPLADFFKCSLPTRKMSDQIYKQADVKLEPKPLTVARDALDTFIQHNQIIEEQRKGKKLGALVGGIKKDVCITNLLQQRANRVAIYGWHQLSGVPIQPLTTVHVDWYVDYSHGIRLIKRAMIVDGQPRDLWDILKDPDLCFLVSDEGPIPVPHYGREPQHMVLLAHRGESYIAPENTVTGIKLAWEKGAEAVEIDVHQTLDHKIVVCHDATTGRTAGTNLVIKDTNSEELRKLDFGKLKGEQYTGEKIPFLEEVLATIPMGGKILCEVKCGPDVLPLLGEVLTASGKRSQVDIISFDLGVVTESKKLMPDVPAYWLQMTKKDPAGNWLPYSDDLIKTALDSKLDGLDLHYAMVTKELVAAIRKAGLALWTWTVNDPADAKHQMELGVDGLATDRCEWLKEQIK